MGTKRGIGVYAAAIALGALVLAGCGGGSGTKGASARAGAGGGGATTTSSGASAATGSGPGSGSAGTAAGAGATPSGTAGSGTGGSGSGSASGSGGSASSGTGSGTTGSGGTGGSGGGASSTSGAAAGTGPKPIATGTYRYRQSGTFSAGTNKGTVPPEGTLVVDPAQADGQQVTHRYVDPKGQPSDVDYLFNGKGIFITSETLRQSTAGGQSVAFVCTLNPAAPTPPWPPTVGAKWSGTANCGSFTATISERVDGTRSVTLDGSPLTTYVIDTTITAKGQLNATIQEQDWFSPSLRLSVHTTSQTNGTYGPIPFSGQATSDLESGRPT